jgi:glutathione S-transferase
VVGSVWGRGAAGARAVYYAASQMGRVTSLTAFLSQWSSRSRADGPANLAKTSVPVLLHTYTADQSTFPSTREAWLRTARKPYTEEERQDARNKLKVGLLDRMEETLRQSRWLADDSYSLADIGAVPFIKRLDEEIAPDEMTSAKHPRVAAWWRAIQSRPAFVTAKIGPFTV